jgi:hypothetical protein
MRPMKEGTMSQEQPQSETSEQDVADTAWLKQIVSFKESLPEHLQYMSKYI